MAITGNDDYPYGYHKRVEVVKKGENVWSFLDDYPIHDDK